MIHKIKIVFCAILCAAFFIGGSFRSAAAQTVGEETFAITSSKLAAADLPDGARRIRDASVPGEIKTTLSKLVAAGGAGVRQGNSEVVVWGGDYKKASGARMIKNLESSLKNAGWEYEIGERGSEFVLFSLFRAEPQRRVLVGFFVPSEDAFILALTEMVRADAPRNVETENPATEETTPSVTKGANEMSIYGKWYRGTGSGFVDNTGKTRYKSGESVYFEFFSNGTVEFTKETDILSIVQCRIKGEDKARGKFSIGGNTLTINLGAMSSWETNSCDSGKNFRKTLPASSVTVQFVIKKMDSITRPDNPTMLCFNGKDGNEVCYEFQPPPKK